MPARALLNLFLLVVAVALVAIIFLRPGLEDNHVVTAVTSIDPQSVRHITLARSDAATLEFSKHVDSWRMAGQPALPADDFQVHTVLALLEATGVRSYPVDALDDLGALGLEPPQASVSFDDTRIDIGNTDAIEGLRYLRVGNTVHLVADRFQHLPNAGFTNFVDRSLLPDDSAINALELPGLSLFQSDGVNWRLVPAREGVSADTIDALVSAWNRTSALYVRRYHAPSATDAEPDTIRITQGDSRPVEFLVITRAPDLVLARPEWGIQYHLPAESGAELLALPEPAVPAPEPGGLDYIELPDSHMPEADAEPSNLQETPLPEAPAIDITPAM